MNAANLRYSSLFLADPLDMHGILIGQVGKILADIERKVEQPRKLVGGKPSFGNILHDTALYFLQSLMIIAYRLLMIQPGNAPVLFPEGKRTVLSHDGRNRPLPCYEITPSCRSTGNGYSQKTLFM